MPSSTAFDITRCHHSTTQRENRLHLLHSVPSYDPFNFQNNFHENSHTAWSVSLTSLTIYFLFQVLGSFLVSKHVPVKFQCYFSLASFPSKDRHSIIFNHIPCIVHMHTTHCIHTASHASYITCILILGYHRRTI